ncbi:uncharacterized protein LOC126236420 [Schistocerca nitens]|uniref:uncharacterized protein LOC126236420 n=1 Tax=Schistocerca nitens TaxID=7011 RepID=UPI002117B28D|nr:uncharacterized protein LOC126236420 [Schistocerca nitens]
MTDRRKNKVVSPHIAALVAKQRILYQHQSFLESCIRSIRDAKHRVELEQLQLEHLIHGLENESEPDDKHYDSDENLSDMETGQQKDIYEGLDLNDPFCVNLQPVEWDLTPVTVTDETVNVDADANTRDLLQL